MSTGQSFRWTEQTKKDLASIVIEAEQDNDLQWKIVTERFKKLHPNFAGKPDAIRKQYSRIHNKNSSVGSEQSVQKSKYFRWTNQAKNALHSIVSTTNSNDGQKWSNVGKQFKQLYPNYIGKDDSLRREFERTNTLKENPTCANLVEDDKITALTATFTWTKDIRMSLVRLVNMISVEGYPNWAKILKIFRRYHPNFNGDKDALKNYYENIDDDDIECSTSAIQSEKLGNWNDNLDLILAQATGHAQYIRSAQVRDGRRKTIENLAKITVKLFKEFFKSKYCVDFVGNDAIILKHFYEYKESLKPSSYISKESSDSMSNINHKMLLAFASKNHSITYVKVFKECCHNCGFLFPRTLNSSNSRFMRAISDPPYVNQIRNNVMYTYKKDDKYITCIECFKNPNWQYDYSVAIKDTMHNIPIELRNLNEYEQNQIALCGGFYSLYQKQNVQRKIFEHRQGECNIGKKRDSDYHNMFTTFFNVNRPHIYESSNEKIKTALQWLRKYNRHYKTFLSNYETIYGYLISHYNLHPDESIIQISKGNFTELVAKDKMGLLIPSENVSISSSINPANHKFGIQHPIQDKLKSLRDTINVNYSDPDLEAKRWPHLFPEGNGSWRRNSALKQQTYVKHRLLSIDPRFRNTNEFMFFWYDRLIKERLLYYNNRRRTVNITELIESIQVKDVRENENKYGAVVPSSIPGSKTYWRARCSDLLALVRDLGKPDLFVTLTQNDNWLELQEVCGEISVKEMKLLDKFIMQPAIGGKSVVKSPIETVVAFFHRLDMFRNSCINNKNGPFGEVIDYWGRVEYQNRGALHCHMVLWIVEDTIPEDIVMAEMPRYSGGDSDIKSSTFIAREYVKTFQMHSCNIGQCKKDITSKCKYGFPYGIQHTEEINDSKMGYTYIRHRDEDKNIVPYNMYALMCWNGHLNVQKVTANGIESYLTKYISKPERSIDIRDITSDTGKFLKSRVVGILECCAHLLQYHQVFSSRKVVFLPCDFQPKQRMLKRKAHLPADEESDEVYYQTLLHKYLVRPKELHNLTYADLYRFYDVEYVNGQVVNTQTDDILETEHDTDTEFTQKCDETQNDFKGRVRKIKSQRMVYRSRAYKYVEKGKSAVPRWRFILPFGSESEKYYEQHLLLNVPINEEDLNEDGYPFNEDNVSKTFIEECCLRGLVDSEETAKSALMGAVQRGFSVDRVIEIAAMFVDQSYVSQEYVDSIIVPWVESMPIVDETQGDADNEYGEELAKMIEQRAKYESYQTYFEKMTDSQKNVMEWVDRKLSHSDQILAIISGGAGVGKSYITKALYSYFIEKKMTCILLATTGSAAHLISGTTVHFYLKVDIHGKKYLEYGSFSAKIIEDTDVIILDEFSMLDSDLLDVLNETTKEFGKSKRSPIGGKHLFLIGDPCQLPAIGKSVFSNPLLNEFSILILKETVRQKDIKFAGLLNRVRVNMMTDEDKSILRDRYIHVSKIECDDESLIVTATRKKMHYYNQQFLANLPGNQVLIQAQDFERDTNHEVSFSVQEKIRRYVKNLWDEKLLLKEGCIVRLLRNIDVSSGWVNSKRAKVFRVANDGSYIVLQDIQDPNKQLPLTKIRQPFKLGAYLYYRYQYPLILGYATTVHAVQGTTVTGKYYVDLDRSFWESGQAFVALSRPKELSQLFLLNTHFEKVYLKPYYKDLLTWMREVDEISILRKPRRYGDFPILVIEEDNQSKVQVFPLIPESFATSQKKSAAFKPPRQITKPILKNKASVPSYSNPNSIALNRNERNFNIRPRVYLLAEAYNNALISSSPMFNKIQFGVKFFNEMLESLNDTLQINDVIDPLFLFEANQPVSQVTLEKWDQQKRLTLALFRKYACQFRTELESFTDMILGLEICSYTGQTLAANIQPLYQDDRVWQPVQAPGDGRCFYHSVSINLLGNASISNALKIVLAFAICNDYDIYDDIFSTLASSASNVLLKVLSFNCWADMEVITAMSYVLLRPVTVVSGLDESEGFRSLNYNPLESQADPIMIGHVKISKSSSKPNHFIALLLDISLAADCSNLLVEDVEMQSDYDSSESL